VEEVSVKVTVILAESGVSFLMKSPEYVTKQQCGKLLLVLQGMTMIVSQLLESSRKRVPWSTMRAIFKMCDLSVGRGWEDTIKKLSEKDEDIPDYFNKLKDCYCNHLLVGEKSLKLFEIKRDKIDEVIEAPTSHEITKTIFHETYPFALPDERLKEISSSPELVKINDSDNQLSVVFCTKRFFTERTEINPDDLSEEAKVSLGSYDELVGIKRYDRQFFDVVVLWKDKDLVEVRIDTTQGGIPSKERSKAFSEIICSFNALLKDNINVNELLKTSINFFPLIDRLYESNEGKVGELAFTTDEGSIKSERMRKGTVDLRNERYHKAGRQAVEHITSYRLAILWRFLLSEEVETQPELLLPGQSHILNRSIQVLDEVIITKCSGNQDYNFVFEKIIEYLYIRISP
jgi:hypothetical protein